MFDLGIVLDIEKGHVETRQAEGHAGGEEHIGHVFEGREFEKLAFRWWKNAGLHKRNGNQ